MINQLPTNRPDQAVDRAIDAAIAKVDQSLPAIRKMAATKKQKKATDRLSSEAARCAFRDMSTDPLLNAEGSDICLCDHLNGKSGPCKGKCRTSA